MRCLVVEDEPDIRSDLGRALEAAGFTVDALGDGESAWFQGDVEDYDVAVLDLGLPRLDGLSVLRRWRAAGRAFPVIVVSARGDWTEKVEGIEAGADDYLSKPFQMGELVARVRGVVRRGAGKLSPTVVAGRLRLDTVRFLLMSPAAEAAAAAQRAPEPPVAVAAPAKSGKGLWVVVAIVVIAAAAAAVLHYLGKL